MKYLAQSRAWRQRAAGALGVTALAAGALSLALASAPAEASPSSPNVHYHFTTLNNGNDTTFNQLLGINDAGKIAGYFGSGVKDHPNKGYLLLPPYHQVDYRNQNFPGSKQTQVTGLNNGGIDVGFWSTMNRADLKNNNFGYYSINGTHFHKVNFPALHPASPPVDQLLGVNDQDLAVGLYNDNNNNAHGYVYDIAHNRYTSFSTGIPGVTSVTPTGINDADCVSGFFTNAHGAVHSFVVCKNRPHLTILIVPGATATQAFGISSGGLVVGQYTVGTKIYGFTWLRGRGFQLKISDPLGVGTTTVNGVNSLGDLVGFYVGLHGNTNGFIAKP